MPDQPSTDEYKRRCERLHFIMKQDEGNDAFRPKLYMRILEGKG